MRLGAKYSLSRTWSNLRFSSLLVSAPIKNASTREALLIRWRRRRDSNPRYAINVYSLSRGAPSATRPLLRVVSLISFDTSLWTLPGSALLDAVRLALRVALVTRALLCDLRSLGQHSATSPCIVTHILRYEPLDAPGQRVTRRCASRPSGRPRDSGAPSQSPIARSALGHFSEFFFNDARKKRHQRDFTSLSRGARE